MIGPCPRCDSTGTWWDGKPCRLCNGLGALDEDVASEYLWAYDKERAEAEHAEGLS